MKFSHGKIIPVIATRVALLLALNNSARQHASFHAVEYRDAPAGLVRIGGLSTL